MRRRILSSLVLAVLMEGCAAGTATSPGVPTSTPGRTESAPPVPLPSPPPPVGSQPAPRPAAKNGGGASGYHTVSVFYGTDRERTGAAEPSNYYGSQRGTVELGVCDVSIPLQHRLGQLETPFFKFLANPASHVVLLLITRMDDSTWVASVEFRLRACGKKNAFIFIHGFNVTFEDACRRTAQLAYDLKFSGAPLMWSWPSDGKLA